MNFVRAVLLATFTAAGLAITPAAAAQDKPAELPAWLAGAWEMQDGAAWSDEYWTLPRGGVMIGVARTGFASRLEMWETTRIVALPDGRLSYFAQPRGVAPTEFTMALQGPDSIEFTNASNPFPQRIRYWRQGQLLVAEVSNIDGSGAVRWSYRPLVNPAEEPASPTLPSRSEGDRELPAVDGK
ncbi:MAG: hypothetical protein KGL44_08685 [Sphingomonadales bacterium]|nr:hypothetical protein [Sphingomonadales bacterium]